MILRGERGIHIYRGTMKRIFECYTAESGIEVKDDDSYHSKLELMATGALSSSENGIKGIQTKIYNAWVISWNKGDFSNYPVDVCIKINPFFEECCLRVLLGDNIQTAVINLLGVEKIKAKLDNTSSKDFKLFAGYDGRRWDLVAHMDANKAVLYINNSLKIEKTMGYLMPFLQVEMARYVVASEIEKKYKARKR